MFALFCVRAPRAVCTYIIKVPFPPHLTSTAGMNGAERAKPLQRARYATRNVLAPYKLPIY